MKETTKVILAGMFAAVGIVLPSLFPMQLNPIILPMHIPILVTGIVVGAKYGLICGFITPLLSSLMWQRPPIYPTALAMAFELTAYGLIIGLVYRLALTKNNFVNIYIALIIAMIIGRIIWGLTYGILLSFDGKTLGFKLFLDAVVITSFPGIALQLIIIPPLIRTINNIQSNLYH